MSKLFGHMLLTFINHNGFRLYKWPDIYSNSNDFFLSDSIIMLIVLNTGSLVYLLYLLVQETLVTKLILNVFFKCILLAVVDRSCYSSFGSVSVSDDAFTFLNVESTGAFLWIVISIKSWAFLTGQIICKKVLIYFKLTRIWIFDSSCLLTEAETARIRFLPFLSRLIVFIFDFFNRLLGFLWDGISTKH